MKQLESNEINIRGRFLIRSAVWNFVGQVSPMLVALVTIPILIDRLGTERFGVLTLIWMVVGYFSLFDLGLGRSLTHLVARMRGSGEEGGVPSVIWTAMALMLAASLIVTLGAIVLSPWLVRSGLRVSSPLQEEAQNAFFLLAACIPIIVSTTALRGVLEAYQRFATINAVRGPLGAFTFAGPLLVLPFSRSLFYVVAVLAVARLATWLLFGVVCLHTVPGLRRASPLRTSPVRPLLAFGGWISVSSVVGPILLYSDRFILAYLMSASIVAYYTVPFDVVIRLLVVPAALLGVFFPAFSSSFGQNSFLTARLYSQATKYTVVVLLPIVILLCLFSAQGLTLWLGAEFSARSYRVAQFIALGVLINSVGLVADSVVQASGRPDLSAKLHLVSLPPYVLCLWYLIKVSGINGAAYAWVLRVMFSTIVLTHMARRCLATAKPATSDKEVPQ